jgi:hypothetical protein
MLTGSTFWVWKERGGGWSLWSGNEGEEGMHQVETRRKLLSRARPRAVVGQLVRLEFDPEEKTMLMEARAEEGERGAEAGACEIYVPVDVTTDRIAVAGAAGGAPEVEDRGDGSRIVRVAVANEGGVYRVALGRGFE